MRRLSEYRRATIPVIGRFNTKSHEIERDQVKLYQYQSSHCMDLRKDSIREVPC